LIRKALELEPGNAEAKAALAAPSAEDLELANYLGDLIRKLGGPEREQAGKDLVLAGAVRGAAARAHAAQQGGRPRERGGETCSAPSTTPPRARS
jgi:hypothetical protein